MMLYLFALLFNFMVMKTILTKNYFGFRSWGKGFDAAPTAGGKTTAVFEKIGTITVPNKATPVYMYGILILIVAQAQTAGQSGLPEMEINSSDLGFINERYTLAEFGFTDPIGTQSGPVVVSSTYVAIPHDEPINNQALDISLASLATMTADWDAHASIVFGDAPLESVPPDYLDELKANFTSSARALGRNSRDAAKAVGSADTDITLTGIDMPNKAKELVGLMGIMMNNASTTIEEICPRFTFESPDIDDFQPQEYPAILGENTALFGTLVGKADGFRGARYYPVRFPLPGSVFTLKVKAQNVIALTVAPDIASAAKFRTKAQ